MSKIDIMTKQFYNVISKEFENRKLDDPMVIGKVISLNPLIINIGDLPLYEKNLFINKYLLEWDEIVNIVTSTSGGEYSHNHTISTIHHPSQLTIGCNVGLYGLEWNDKGKTYQKYHVIDVVE